jgi:hypothetical protein
VRRVPMFMRRPAMASQASGPPPQVLAPWTSSAGQKRIPCRAAAFERLRAVRQQAAPQGGSRRLPVALGTTDTTERLVVLWRDCRGGRALAERGSLEGPAWRSCGFRRRDHVRRILFLITNHRGAEAQRHETNKERVLCVSGSLWFVWGTSPPFRTESPGRDVRSPHALRTTRLASTSCTSPACRASRSAHGGR